MGRSNDLAIVKASNGLEAQEVLKENSDIKIILSDYSMPKANGGQLYKFNTSETNLPFILMTAGSLDDYEEFNTFYKDNKLNAFLEKRSPDWKINTDTAQGTQ